MCGFVICQICLTLNLKNKIYYSCIYFKWCQWFITGVSNSDLEVSADSCGFLSISIRLRPWERRVWVLHPINSWSAPLLLKCTEYQQTLWLSRIGCCHPLSRMPWDVFWECSQINTLKIKKIKWKKKWKLQLSILVFCVRYLACCIFQCVWLQRSIWRHILEQECKQSRS